MGGSVSNPVAATPRRIVTPGVRPATAGGHGRLEHGPAGGDELEALVPAPQGAAPGLGEHLQDVGTEAAGGRQLVEDLGELPLHQGPPARLHEMGQVELVDPPTLPRRPCLRGRRRLRRVAFEDRHVVAVAGEQHGRGQAAKAGAEHEYLRHRAPPGVENRCTAASSGAVLTLQARRCSVAAQSLPDRAGSLTSPISTAHSRSVSCSSALARCRR